MTRLAILASLGCLAAMPAFAQGGPRIPAETGTIVQQQQNATGNDPGLVISRGATGADTINTDSAAGGNASRPEQAFPNGSANGGGGGAR